MGTHFSKNFEVMANAPEQMRWLNNLPSMFLGGQISSGNASWHRSKVSNHRRGGFSTLLEFNRAGVLLT